MRYTLTLPFLFFLTVSIGQTSFYTQSPKAQHWVDSVFKTLSKNEKIAQLMVMRASEIREGKVFFYEEKLSNEIKKYNIGSICLFQGSPVEQAQFINRLQKLARTPLMVCIDGEMGLGMRMTDSVAKFPDQITLGAIHDKRLIYQMGVAMGEQCKRMGIHVDYAPDVDINNNPNNPVIGYRSFGEDKYTVSEYGMQIMKGLQSMGVMACAKHFPGHGDVAVDSHFDLPVINKSRKQLDELETVPFKRLINEGVGSVMVAHLFVPSIDTTSNRPTSLSANAINGILRKDLGFTGITFTDALEMKGVAKFYPQGDAAAQSLIAGNDMLCLPGDIESSIEKIKAAIKHKKLSWADIDHRVKKVLLAKYNLGLNNISPIDENNLTSDLNKDVPGIRTAVAKEAITLLRMQNPSLLPLSRSKKIAYVGIGADTLNTISCLLKNNFGAESYYISNKADATTTNAALTKIKNTYDIVIIGLHRYAKSPINNFGINSTIIDFVRQLASDNKAVLLTFGNPYVIKNFCDLPNLVSCYEDDAIFQSAAFDFLTGKISTQGHLPVTVCPEYPFGSGMMWNAGAPVFQPEQAGLNSSKLKAINNIVNDAIAKHAFPGCVVLVARNGKVVMNNAFGYLNYDSTEPAKPETIYDLASVTKISATTVSIMRLYEEGKLDLNKTLGDYLPWVKGSDKAPLLIKDILLHQAGLVAFIPFYKETIDAATGKPLKGFYQEYPDEKYSVRVTDNMYMRNDWVDSMYHKILQSKLGEKNKYVYSDNDFIFLGKVVEQLSGKTLDEYAAQNFYQPLAMHSTTFRPRLKNVPISQIAPTEKEKYFRLQLIRGDVHDPGAAMFGGVAGHAGLFSNAYDLAKLYMMLLNGGEWNNHHYFDKKTIDYFTAYHSDISRRGYGFDKPEKDNATNKDPYPSKYASPQAFGHTGFTGIGVWADPKENLLVIFMSNRVCPDSENPLISKLEVRRKILDAVYEAIEK